MKTLRRIFVLFSFLAMWPALVVEGSDSPSSAGTDRAADGPVYYHEDRHVGRDISQLVAKCPFAYYPSINQLEVAFLAPPALRAPLGLIKQPCGSGRPKGDCPWPPAPSGLTRKAADRT